jgi:N-carbamoylputrescine amidase
VAADGAVVARAGLGTEEILYADVDLASTASFHARLLFLRHRRPRLYGEWLTKRSADFAEEVAI